MAVAGRGILHAFERFKELLHLEVNLAVSLIQCLEVSRQCVVVGTPAAKNALGLVAVRADGRLRFLRIGERLAQCQRLLNLGESLLLHQRHFSGRQTLQADAEVLLQLVFQFGEVAAAQDLGVHIAVAVQPQEHFRAQFKAALLLRAV